MHDNLLSYVVLPPNASIADELKYFPLFSQYFGADLFSSYKTFWLDVQYACSRRGEAYPGCRPCLRPRALSLGDFIAAAQMDGDRMAVLRSVGG